MVGGVGEVLSRSTMASTEAGEVRRELRMNPALLEWRERRTLNNPTGLCIEPASCEPLPEVKDGSGSRPGVVGRKFSGEY